MSQNEGWTNSEPLDFDGVSTEPPPPLEDGIYQARVVKAEPRKTKDGAPGMSVELSVTSSVTASGSTALDAPRKVFDTLVFSKGALFRTKQLCKASGAEPPKSTAFGDIEDFCESLVGLDVYLRSKRQTWNGKVNAKVDRYIGEEQLADAIAGKSESGEAEAAPATGGRKRRRAT